MMAKSVKSNEFPKIFDEFQSSNSEGESDVGSEIEDYLEIEIQQPTDSETEDLTDIPINATSDSDRPRKRSRVLDLDSSDDERIHPSSGPKIIHPGCLILQGKDGHKWSTNPVAEFRPHSGKTVKEGPQDKGKDVTNPMDIFSLFVNDEMLDQIVVHTNDEINDRRLKYAQQTKRIDNTSMSEVKALLGLLLLSAGLKSNHLPTRILFNSTYSASRFKACMTYERFEFLVNCLRFDDKASRPVRKINDKFAAFRTIWENFIDNCKTYYSPGVYMTVEEQLVGFRGRCPFRMYIPNKPCKYGLKIVMVTDAKTKYVYNAMPYLGKESTAGMETLPDFYVKKLSEPIHGSNRNLTMGNWFSSVPLASDLLKPPYNLTTVATLRGNARQIPKELHDSKSRKVGTSMFCFDGEKTLVSYKPKNNKVVYLLSTTHEQPSINPTNGKPEILEFYNSTKGSVDTIDQMCANMSTSRNTKRWPLCLFYNLLNLTIINSYVIYVCNLSRDNKKIVSRREFILKLAEDLMSGHLLERFNTPTLRRDIRESIREILKIEQNFDVSEPNAIPSRKICALCPSKSRKMTKSFCIVCKKAVCRAHNVNVCPGCAP